MGNYSSKICTKCYSVQEPASRFCDNCGKAFASTAAIDGNISIVTKAFLKRQVAETRPLFWLCIIIVAMLGVFGFAQAGMYFAKSGTGNSAASQPTASLLSNDVPHQFKPLTVPMTSEEMATQSNDGLDLNNSVFEMSNGHSPRSPRAKPRSASTAKLKPVSATAETVTAHTSEKIEAAAVKPDTTAEKAAETNAVPRKYVRGPMGGCYYISASGSKRYVDRGLCS